MLNTVTGSLKSILSKLRICDTSNLCKSDIEKFILSKNPQNTAEAEYWMKVYSYSSSRRGWL
jgi:hypothetical protein